MADVTDLLPIEGYENVRTLPNGIVIGTQRMMFTTGLFVGLTADSWQKRFCYERDTDAAVACIIWDGNEDPPGNWIKEKPSDRLNPNWSRSDD